MLAFTTVSPAAAAKASANNALFFSALFVKLGVELAAPVSWAAHWPTLLLINEYKVVAGESGTGVVFSAEPAKPIISSVPDESVTDKFNA